MGYYVNKGSCITVGVVFPAVAALALLGRLGVKRFRNNTFGADDMFACLGFALTLGVGIIMIYGAARDAIGSQDVHRTVSQTFQHLQYSESLLQKLKYAFFIIQTAAAGCIRISILCFYARIFRGRAFTFLFRSLLVVLVLWTIGFLFAMIFVCGTHFSAYWGDEVVYRAHCQAIYALEAAVALSAAVLDVFLLAIPLYFVSRLHMENSRKLGVMAVFAVGIFSVAAGLTRTVLQMEEYVYPTGSTKPLFGLSGTTDPNGVLSTIIFWAYVETGVGCIVCNMPMLSSLIKKNGPLTTFFDWVSMSSLSPSRNRDNKENSNKGDALDCSSEPSTSKSEGVIVVPKRAQLKVADSIDIESIHQSA